MNYIFFGSPRFAELVLTELIRAGLPPAAIVTNPDRPSGRKKILTPPPAKLLAQGARIPVLQPEDPLQIEQELTAIHPDLFIVAAYGKIIPESILSIAPLTIGVHPSLLPQYRGASPIQSALLAGESETGVTLYQMDKEMDHGPLFIRESIPIEVEETYESLQEKLGKLAGQMLVQFIPKLAKGDIFPVAQTHTEATFTKKISTQDGEVDMTQDSPLTIYRKIQALNPDPGVFTYTFPGREGKRVKLLAAQFADGKLTITRIQPEGKKPFLL